MSYDPNPLLEQAFLKGLGLQDARFRQAITFEPAGQARRFVLRHGAIELEGLIDNRGIVILVEHAGEYWDELLSLVVVPAAVEGGFHCLACIRSERRVFADVETLWRNHLFGPLLGWTRRKLFRADRLGFYSERGATWVRLLRPGDDPRKPDAMIYAEGR